MYTKNAKFKNLNLKHYLSLFIYTKKIKEKSSLLKNLEFYCIKSQPILKIL